MLLLLPFLAVPAVPAPPPCTEWLMSDNMDEPVAEKRRRLPPMLKKEEVGVCDGACDGACDDTADDKQDGVTLQCIRSIRGTRTPLAPLTIVIIIVAIAVIAIRRKEEGR